MVLDGRIQHQGLVEGRWAVGLLPPLILTLALIGLPELLRAIPTASIRAPSSVRVPAGAAAFQGTGSSLMEDPYVQSAYLGLEPIAMCGAWRLRPINRKRATQPHAWSKTAGLHKPPMRGFAIEFCSFGGHLCSAAEMLQCPPWAFPP